MMSWLTAYWQILSASVIGLVIATVWVTHAEGFHQLVAEHDNYLKKQRGCRAVCLDLFENGTLDNDGYLACLRSCDEDDDSDG